MFNEEARTLCDAGDDSYRTFMDTPEEALVRPTRIQGDTADERTAWRMKQLEQRQGARRE